MHIFFNVAIVENLRIKQKIMVCIIASIIFLLPCIIGNINAYFNPIDKDKLADAVLYLKK